MRKVALGWDNEVLLNDPDIRASQLCCECGICEIVACPMGLQPRKINSALKKRLAQASIRWSDDGEREYNVRPFRDEQRIPTMRVASRAGVFKYFNREIDRFDTLEPDSVTIPLKMHIGVPCAPVVSVGDRVKRGQRIAIYPENELGADIHSSIDGTVTEVDGRITIVRG
jgi:Na+-translocating ferredoxin:NAD+ oxidoreductase RnfC subunit